MLQLQEKTQNEVIARQSCRIAELEDTIQQNALEKKGLIAVINSQTTAIIKLRSQMTAYKNQLEEHKKQAAGDSGGDAL